ncbi:hypothetical protein BJX64DRAFT_296885 [Aspergillus heterothallicus]
MPAMTQVINETPQITLSTTTGKDEFLLPPAAFDTHVHVFDPAIGPYATGRAYTPEDAPIDALLAFNKSISRDGTGGKIVLVQPSPYGTDCTVLMRCLRELRAKQRCSAYAIAVVDLQSITDGELEEMHEAGVRGIRLNFQADGKGLDVMRLRETLYHAAERIRHLPGWMIQLFVPGWVWDSLFDCISTLPVSVIADHLGGMKGASKLPSHLAEDSLSQPGFTSLIALAQQSKVIVKISGLYRASERTTSFYGDTQPIIQAFARHIPDQCIWGSDWPHTGEGKDRVKNGDLTVKEPFRSIDNQALLRNIREWVGDGVYAKIMEHNSARLFRD